MENRDILIDTSIIIEFLRKQNKQLSYLWKIKEAGFNCLISTITVFELYAGAITKRHKKDLNKLMKWMDVIPLTTEIAQRSAEIYKDLKSQNQPIEFRDIFIGATAVEVNVLLLTLNEKHFKRIKGIKIYNKENI
ncbi:hypothetical protein JCM13304A_20230 [Desulfothermus okinawensis JCM 13304]